MATVTAGRKSSFPRSRGPGRPTGNESEVRDSLLKAARALFLARGFASVTIRQIAESKRYTGFTEQSLRSLIKRGEATGFDRCLRRSGRRIFIDTAAMDRWLEEQARWR